MNLRPLAARAFKPAVFVLALLPLGLLVWSALHDALGANPVEAITFETGEWGLRFLLITLCVTPLRRITGWQALARVRRMLGLFAFFYVCLHFLTYVVLDAFFDLAYILEDISDRTYITLGFTSFLLLIPLAMTSTNAMMATRAAAAATIAVETTHLGTQRRDWEFGDVAIAGSAAVCASVFCASVTWASVFWDSIVVVMGLPFCSPTVSANTATIPESGHGGLTEHDNEMTASIRGVRQGCSRAMAGARSWRSVDRARSWETSDDE